MAATTDADLTPDLIDRVRKLSPDALDELMGLVLDYRAGPPDDPAQVAKAWKDEIARRWQEVLDGTAELHDARTVLADARRRLREKHGI